MTEHNDAAWDDPRIPTDAAAPGNYCKVAGCAEPFAYDHRCEQHAGVDHD